MNDLILAPIQPVPVALSAELRARVESLVLKAKEVSTVESPEQQAKAAEVCRAIAGELKEIETSRQTIKAPILEIGKQIDQVAKEASGPLSAETSRISQMVSKFQVAEARRVAAEAEQARLAQEKLAREAADLVEKAKLAQLESGADAAIDAMVMDEMAKEKMAQLSASVATPPPAPVKAAGMVVRPKLNYKITEPGKVFARWPHFFDLKEKRSVILGTITKDFDCPGMQVWEEVSTSFRST